LYFKPDTENNANFDAVSSKLSEIFLSQVFWAATFGEQPRQAADAHLLLLAGSQAAVPTHSKYACAA